MLFDPLRGAKTAESRLRKTADETVQLKTTTQGEWGHEEVYWSLLDMKVG